MLNLRNLNPQTGSYVGDAQPRGRNLESLACRQTFSGQPANREVQPIARPKRTFFVRVIRRNTARVNRAVRAMIGTNIGFKLKEIFKLFQIYKNPTFVRLFSPTDNTDTNSKGRRLVNWLTDPNAIQNTGIHDLNFDPNIPNKFGCKTMLQALIDGDIKLEFEGLLGIWLGKMLNTDHEHFLKFVTGVGLLNFKNHLAGGTKTIIGLETPILTEKMEKIKHIYSLLYLGLCLHMLINDKAVSIQKKTYNVQTYLQRLVRRNSQNNYRNETMYSVVYDRKLQFYSKKGKRINKVTIRCIFNIFRIQTADGPETKINISSCFPRGILDKIKCFLWQFDINPPDLNFLAEQERADQQKFDYITNYFKIFSIFDTLNKIYPNFQNDEILKIYLEESLKVQSFEFDEVMKPFAKIMDWPTLDWTDNQV